MINTRLLKRIAIGQAPLAKMTPPKVPLPVNIAGTVGDWSISTGCILMEIVICPHPGSNYEIGVASVISHEDGLWFTDDCVNYNVPVKFGQSISIKIFGPVDFDQSIAYGTQVVVRNISIKRGDNIVWFNATDVVKHPERSVDQFLINELVPPIKFCTSPTHLSKVRFGKIDDAHSNLIGEMRYNDNGTIIIDLSWDTFDLDQKETVHVECSIYQEKIDKLLSPERSVNWLYDHLDQVFNSDITLVGFLKPAGPKTRRFFVRWVTFGDCNNVDRFVERLSHVTQT